MRADDIGLIAKKDPLICKYAYSYIKGRQSKGNIDLVRQNMRRLAKLLQHARKTNSEIKTLVDILRPVHFQLIIKGVNKMAQYNSESERYDSPTLAINFGTLIKKCCDLAYVDLLQINNTERQRKEIKILKKLVECQWADEVSAQAGTNLSESKWNKEELLPLTSDLKKLSLFLQQSADQEYNILLVNRTNELSYTTLKEILYTQILLLNRRRPAEVAQLKIQTFKEISLESEDGNEFERCLTETEKVLLNTYSRFVIRGKRGRGVPVLLSPEMKKYFDLLLEVRNTFSSGNDYIFHTTEKGFIDGTKVLHKYVKKCKVEKPGSITATRLRKHLATITQLLQFSNNDMEQLSKFMGHTLKTHCGVYRISDKIYQTAKISKLLLLMLQGGAESFKGKSLDEINIDLSPIYDEEDEQDNSFLNIEEEAITTGGEGSEGVDSRNITVNKRSKRVMVGNRLTWTNTQKRLVAEHFSMHIQNKRSPKQHEVHDFVQLYPDLFKERKWTSIKAVAFNMYTNKLKY
nr:unnamed protein product [Callosobruchus analis]